MSEPGIGHNAATTEQDRRKLRSFVSRIDALADERRSLSDDIRDIYDEAKAAGFLPDAIRHLIRMQRMEREKRERLETAIAQYELALEPVDPPAATLPDADTSAPPFLPDDGLRVAEPEDGGIPDELQRHGPVKLA